MAKAAVAIVGGESLAGGEVREAIHQRGLPARVGLVGCEEADAAILTERGGEPVVMTGLDSTRLAEARVVFLAGSEESSHRARKLLGPKPEALLVDLSGHLEEEVNARLRAPFAEAAAMPPGAVGCVEVVAHPAAILLAMVYRRLCGGLSVSRCLANVFEPASERGKAGIEELQRQTVNLLSFQPIGKAVFDAQLSFAMLPRYGSQAKLALSGIEQRIDRHLASLLAHLPSPPPMPSLRLIQAPVLHGYCVQLWMEFDSPPEVEALAALLRCPEIDVWGDDLDPPGNVSVAGQRGLSIGVVEKDRNNARAVWMWLAADNMRLHADNAVEVARGRIEAEAAA